MMNLFRLCSLSAWLFASIYAAPSFGQAVDETLEKRQQGSDPNYCTGRDYPCTNGVFFLGARGADGNNSMLITSPGYGNLEGMEDIAKAIIARTGGYCRGVPYPAVEIGPYQDSVNIGVMQTRSIISNYVDTCGSNSKIILLGYSSGGQVMTSALAGLFPVFGTLSGKYAAAVKGGVLFGSLSWRYGYSPVNAGDATRSAAFADNPITYNTFNQQFGNRVRNYCQAGDAACANGGLNSTAIAIHLDAIQHFKQDAISFLNGLV